MKKIMLLALTLTVIFLVGCAAEKKADISSAEPIYDSAMTNYESLFEQATKSDGALSEYIASLLSDAYDRDPDGLLSAMKECPDEQIQVVVDALVYGRSYGDIVSFEQDIHQRLDEDDPILTIIVQAINKLEH